MRGSHQEESSASHIVLATSQAIFSLVITALQQMAASPSDHLISPDDTVHKQWPDVVMTDTVQLPKAMTGFVVKQSRGTPRRVNGSGLWSETPCEEFIQRPVVVERALNL